MDYPTKKELQEIETRWFKNHNAALIDLGNIQRLRWGAPNTSCYQIIYIIDGHTLIVYGDLGEAIYQWGGKINLEFLSTIELGYFHGKTQASEKGRCMDNYEFSFDKFKEELIKTVEQDRAESPGAYKDLDLDSIKYCDEDEFGAIAWLREQNLDGETMGSFLRAGKSIPLRCASHLIGLKMAFAQLNNQPYNGTK